MLISIDKKGIARNHPIPESEGMMHWYDDESMVSQWLSGDEAVNKIDERLTTLRYAVEKSVFVTNDVYRAFNACLPMYLEATGYRPSSAVSSVAFQQICDNASCETLNRYLYVQDVWWLADSFNASHAIAAESLAGFWRELSRVDCPFDYDGVFEVMGVDATPALKELQSFVLSLYASLDMATKLIHALRNPPLEFSSVGSHIGGQSLFQTVQGREAASAQDGSLFERCWETAYLGDLRNEIIHNRALDATGVIFVRRSGGRIVERFVLLPDADENGKICSWKNRRRFYSLELKANDLAPHLFIEISERLVKSLDEAIACISFDNAVELTAEEASGLVVRLAEAYARFACRV